MINRGSTEQFLQLVRLGIGTETAFYNSGYIDWILVESLAMEQGLSAILIDAVERLPERVRPSKGLLLQWIGATLQDYEYRYESYLRAIAGLSGFYNSHGLQMMVLKGFACSLDWPKPNHRPSGDIDIWLFGNQKEADNLIRNEKGIAVDTSEHHHTVFSWLDFTVENHYDFVNVHDYSSSQKLELLFKQLGKDDSHYTILKGEKVYLPSPNLHALFLMRHMVSHFASVSITLRQVLDWAFFVKAHNDGVDWDWFIAVLEKYHMLDFYNCINGICVENLGFDVNIFPSVQFDPLMKERVLQDIINPEYEANEPKHLLNRIRYKYNRWKGNWWKQELCYRESRCEGFLKGVWYHLLKPSSI